jgi:hypothetical protein
VTDRQRPGWLDELIGIVKRLCPDPGNDIPDSEARVIGRVSADAELGAGWFWIGLGGRKLDDDQLEAAYLAPAEGARRLKFQLIETLHDGNVLKVRVSEHAPTDGLFLWSPARAPGLLEKSLLDALSSIDRFTLVSQFAQGRADIAPASLAFGSNQALNAEHLNAEQWRACRACRSPGLQLVWGPPGTGKTKVVAQALQTLIADGESALLVSATNIAVDNALAKAAAIVRPAPGVMVRAGPPHLPEVAQDPAICLDLLVRHRQEALEKERRRLEDQITALQAAPDLTELAAAESDLHGFDLPAYLTAEDRLRCAESLSARKAEMARAQEQEAEAAMAARAADDDYEKISTEHSAAEPARRFLADADDRQRMLADLTLSVGMAEDDISRLAGQRDHLAGQLSAARARRRFGHGHLKTLIGENTQHLAAATSRRDAAQARLRQLAPQLDARIAESLRAALPHTPASLAELDERLAKARKAAHREREAWEACTRLVRKLMTGIQRLQLRPEPTAEDEEIVLNARSHDLPGKLAKLPELKRRAESIHREIARLTEDHERVVSRMLKEASQARREIVRGAKVVATTLARLRLRKELRERDYDYVIVDEVSFACVPEVLYAASRAIKGVTLLGDFLQNGPIVPEAFKNLTDDAVRRWYGQDCFALFGIRDATSAQTNPGCVTLTRQYRFGFAINELANVAAYHGVLQAASRGDHAKDDEIVLIDVDGLGDELAGIHRAEPGRPAGWWPIGVLLAKALTERRIRLAEEARESTSMKAGIVVPYRIQQQIMQDVLNESGASPQIEVGTSHRFQGREFDTVVFDIVDDGKGWVGKGDLGGTSYQADGLRMFNVGITRARRRLYLIANAATVRRARTGPLHAVQLMIDAGMIHVVRAAEVIDLPDAPANEAVASELWHALRSHATLLDLFDEERLPDELCRRIEEAQERIWLWSPWVGRRSEQLLPHLRQAEDRKVSVHLVVLPSTEVNRHLKPRHEELETQIAQTIHLRKEHQKIVIIDRNLTFIGSMNVLAHVPGGRHEIMALFQSSALVEQVLRHERADQLARPPACGQCGAPVTHVGARTDHGERRLEWICTAELDGRSCNWRRTFPDLAQTRNQPRRQRK